MNTGEHRNAYGRAYYRRHREEILKQKKEYRGKNREKISAQRRADYLKNKKRIITKANEWKAKNPKRFSVIQKRYRDSNKAGTKVRSRTHHLREQYGMTEAGYLALLESQGGTCAICQTKRWTGKNKAPVIDHDHQTGRVRGILCHKCNAALALAGEDPDRLEAMAAYIRATRRNVLEGQTEAPAPGN